MRATVALMRASFEARELNSVRWVPGIKNVAEALTKRNEEMSKEL